MIGKTAVPTFSSAGAGSLVTVAPDDVIGFKEVVRLLDRPKSTVARWTNEDDFPQPLEELASGRVWRRRDVEAWAKTKLPRRTGRPPRSG